MKVREGTQEAAVVTASQNGPRVTTAENLCVDKYKLGPVASKVTAKPWLFPSNPPHLYLRNWS